MNKKRKIIYFLVAILAVVGFLGVGYAQISDITLDISGTASIDKAEGVVITDVKFLSSNNANNTDSKINSFYKTVLDSKVVLGNDNASSITYQVTIKNLTTTQAKFDQAIYDEAFYDNESIVYELGGIAQGDVIESGDSLTFTITFHYKGEDTSNNTLNSYINFRFDTGYTITYHLNGGSVTGTNPTEYTEATETFTIINPTKVGYTFTGWTGSNGTVPAETLSITEGTSGNLDYTANWRANTYTVKMYNRYDDSLPVNYQRLEYLESTGTQWIDTEETPTRTTDIEVTFQSDSTSTYQRIFGQPEAAGNDRFQVQLSSDNPSNKIHWYCGIGGHSTSGKALYLDATKEFKTIKLESGVGWYLDGTFYADTATEANSYPIWLFRGFKRYSELKISSAKIWKDGNLIRNFIPVYRISDGITGMYDTVNDKFHARAGDDEFTLGAEIPSVISQTYTYDVSQSLTANSITREGYTFLGWTTDSAATTVTYTDAEEVLNLSEINGEIVKLYAIWEKN